MTAEQILDVGHPRVLRLDLNALALFEQLTGRSLLSPGGWSSLTASDLRTLVWAAAAQTDPGVSLHTIGRELTPDRMPDLVRVLEEWGVSGQPAAPAPDTETAAAVAAPSSPPPEDPKVETARVLAAFGARRA